MPSPHQYGPHRPEDAPNAVTVLGAGKWPRPEVRPMPEALARQRAQLNQLAAESASLCKRDADGRLVSVSAWCRGYQQLGWSHRVCS